MLQDTHSSSPKSLARVWRYSNMPQLLGIALCFTLAFAMMEQTIGLFIERVWTSDLASLEERHREAAKLTAYFLVAVGVGASLVQGGLIGRLTKRFGEVSLVVHRPTQAQYALKRTRHGGANQPDASNGVSY